MSMLAALGQVANFAVGLGSSPLTVIGLVPIFAAGLAFMRYVSIDPESHPIDIRYVSTDQNAKNIAAQTDFPD